MPQWDSSSSISWGRGNLGEAGSQGNPKLPGGPLPPPPPPYPGVPHVAPDVTDMVGWQLLLVGVEMGGGVRAPPDCPGLCQTPWVPPHSPGIP